MVYLLLLISALCLGWTVQHLSLVLLNRFSRYQQSIRLRSMMEIRKTVLPLQTFVSFLEGNQAKFFKTEAFRKYFLFLSGLLQRANLKPLKPEHVLGYQAVGAMGASFLFGALTGSLELALLTFVMGAFLPLVWLRDKALRRERQLLRELPNALEVISLCTEAGLSLEQGIEQYLKNARSGPIQEELGKVLEQTRTGSSRKEAFEAMSGRLGLTDFSLFVTSLIHAERFGTGVSQTLRQLSLTMRDKQYQRAEKAIQEMPVKLLIPLILFIMPVTFLIIFGPIALQFFH